MRELVGFSSVHLEGLRRGLERTLIQGFQIGSLAFFQFSSSSHVQDFPDTDLSSGQFVVHNLVDEKST